MVSGDLLALLHDSLDHPALGFASAGVVLIFGSILLINVAGTLFKMIAIVVFLALVTGVILYWQNPGMVYEWIKQGQQLIQYF
ncbi:MAG: hypothetical protein IBX50_08215 [Marinospirillum sp.]|uniref:hypothetical protein n=1 Tax=Marinospirillum sp. TaxID=2183934 RepID=UPI0019E0A86C|nr:hypothetical protein [Marinospirillum sp.]MBE0506690.1 hypothetical protein [Marinospirillum sp.]